MITLEMLDANEATKGLSPELREAIVQMSKNDENATIGAKIGELHGQYDADVFGITGVAKKEGEKSYVYVKRVLSDYKNKIDSTANVRNELEQSKTQLAELQAKLEANAHDETLAQQLKDSKAQIERMKTQFAERETAFNTAKAKLESDIKGLHVDYAFKAAVSGLKFKGGITEGMKRILLDSAKAEVMAKGTPDVITDEAGAVKLVFRDANGAILTNMANNLNPMTVEDMVRQTTLMDAIETTPVQTGGGTHSPSNTAYAPQAGFTISGARTQVEADNMIAQHLLSQGITRDSLEFSSKLREIRDANQVGNLPIR